MNLTGLFYSLYKHKKKNKNIKGKGKGKQLEKRNVVNTFTNDRKRDFDEVVFLSSFLCIKQTDTTSSIAFETIKFTDTQTHQ